MEIRDFRIRGNYIVRRHLLPGPGLHALRASGDVRKLPGYSPPVVEFEACSGTRGSVVVRDIDLPFLCQDDFEKAKHHLALILNAGQGDPQAGRDLSAAVQEHRRQVEGGSEGGQPAESRFVVPSTSCEAHSEQAVSHKGSILLKLSQLGYPVPDFVILTSETYTDRAKHLEEHLTDAVRQLGLLTMQRLGDAGNPLVFALRCAMPQYIPGVMQTFLNVGVTERTLPGLERVYGPVAARKMFLNNLRNLCLSLDREGHQAIADAVTPDLPPDRSSVTTEHRHAGSMHLHAMNARRIVDLMNAENLAVHQAMLGAADRAALRGRGENRQTARRGLLRSDCFLRQTGAQTFRGESGSAGDAHPRVGTLSLLDPAGHDLHGPAR